MNEIEYYEMQENAAIGQAIGMAVSAIFNEYLEHLPEAERTMRQLQRAAYKYTDAGVSVGFKLFDGSCVWNGDSLANDLSLVNQIEDICIGSIVEGSDAEVPPVWLNLHKIADGSDKACDKYPDDTVEQLAIRRWYETLEWVNDEACALWHEANDEEAQP